MPLKPQRITLLVVATAILLLTASFASSQENPTPSKRLRSPATVRGFVGGESQQHYVIRARKGQTMTVRISWRRQEDNEASFSVSPAVELNLGEQFVDDSNSKPWTVKIPKTGDYYISVVAHPSARYTLRVSIK